MGGNISSLWGLGEGPYHVIWSIYMLSWRLREGEVPVVGGRVGLEILRG